MRHPSPIRFTFVIFTYGEDAWMVGQCIRALRKLGANRKNIFIYDDAAHPLPYPPKNVQYSQTHFNRHGNLNGRECVEGELFCMMEAAKKSDAHVIVKVDSDVIINSLAWIENLDFMGSHIGFHIGEGKRHLSGCAYSLPSWSILPMLKKLHSTPLSDSIGESIAISHLAKSIGLSQEAYECNSSNPDLWRASSIDGREMSNGELSPHAYHLMKNLDVVLCDLIAPQRDKARNFQLMKTFLDNG